jgi:hypothetical protein
MLQSVNIVGTFLNSLLVSTGYTRSPPFSFDGRVRLRHVPLPGAEALFMVLLVTMMIP